MHVEEYTYLKLDDLPLKATLYRSASPQKNKTILYFHGGGLVYGSRNDLPDDYVKRFLDAGYHLLTFDYLLAPESPLQDILFSTVKAVEWFLAESRSTLAIDHTDYILFGRSAGAYLCFLLSREHSLPAPNQIIAFYGYDSLDYREFQTPSPYYSKYPQLTESIVNRMLQSHPLAEGSLQTRYAIYLYARQKGKWTDFLKVSDPQDERFGLTKKDLRHLPPTFIAHSTNDTDVPYHIAEKLAHTIPHACLHSVAGVEHDFDRDGQSEIARKAYDHVLDWLL